MAPHLRDALVDRGPLSRSEILELGVGRSLIEAAPELRVHHGIYCEPDPFPNLVSAARAALASCSGPALVSGLAALRLLEVRIPHSLGHGEWTPDERISLVVHSGRTRVRRPGIECHVTHQPLEPWCVVSGIPLAHPARSWLYMAKAGDVQSLVLLGDALMRRKRMLIEPSELADVLENPGCVPGIKKARRALGLIRPGTETMGETWIRLKIIEAGLPCPDVNVAVRRPDNDSFFLLDQGYLELVIAIEVDGPVHADVDQWKRDVSRENLLKSMGWQVVRTSPDDYRDPADFIAALKQARARAIAAQSAASCF